MYSIRIPINSVKLHTKYNRAYKKMLKQTSKKSMQPYNKNINLNNNPNKNTSTVKKIY